MSIPDRLFRISKAYLNQVRDRIDSELSDRESAMRELDNGRGGERGTDADDLMRRAEEKIAATRRQADSQRPIAPSSPANANPTASATPAAEAVTAEEASAYRIMGVPVGSDLSTVQAAYEKLAARCDPRRFPDGSQEQTDATRILEKVNAAMDTLRKRLDPTNNRFGKLEFE